MALDVEGERRRQKELKRKKGGYGWRPESGLEGGNIIRVLKFKHKVTKDDVKNGVFSKEDLGKTKEAWDRMVTTYYKGDKDSPQERFLLNIVDLTSKNGASKVETWMCPKSVRVPIGDYLGDEDYGEEIFGVEGRDFKVYFDKEADASQMYKITIREAKLCKELDSDLAEKVIDFYDPEVYKKFSQSPDERGEDSVSKKRKEDEEGNDDDNLE